MKKVFRIGIIVLLVAALLIGYTIYKKQKSKPEWRLDTASSGRIREEVTASGTLNASSQVEVGTEISGKIEKLYKDFNDTVKRGELLARLDMENLQSTLESARSDVGKAQLSMNDTKLDLDLQKELFNKGMGTSYDLQKAQNKYDQSVQSLNNARSTLKKAEKNLNNATITSPIDGVVVSRNVEEGQTVAASMSSPTLFVIANNLRKMQINADVDEADIGKIKVGQPVEFTVDAFADEQFEGVVKQVRLSPNNSNNVVTYTVVIDVDNSRLKLLPGMTANVTIVVRSKENILRIPETAIRFKPSKELWQQFGLKWDDTLFKRTGGWNRSSMGTSNSAGNSDNGNSKSNLKQQGQFPNLPDSLKAKLAKMSPEQRKAFFRNMRKDNDKTDMSKLTPEQRKAFRDRSGQGDKAQENSDTALTSTGQFMFGSNADNEEKTSHGKVWVLENGKPKAIDIVTGLTDGTYVEVISGLKENQEFITGVNYKNAKQASNNNSSAFSNRGFGPH